MWWGVYNESQQLSRVKCDPLYKAKYKCIQAIKNHDNTMQKTYQKNLSKRSNQQIKQNT